MEPLGYNISDNTDITLVYGDCFDKMKDIPDRSVDMVLCDLPYEVLNKSNKHAQWDRMLPLGRLWEEYERIIKDNGAIVLFAQGMFTARLMTSNERLWKYNLIWKKGNRPTGFLNAKKMPMRIHEDICVFYKSLPTYNPQMVAGTTVPHSKGTGKHKDTMRCYGKYDPSVPVKKTTEKYPTSVIDIPKEHKDFFHPTQKPVALLEWLIRTYTNEGELVLDNTAGSMSTAVAAINTGRRCICIENNEEYYGVGVERVKKVIEGKELKTNDLNTIEHA